MIWRPGRGLKIPLVPQTAEKTPKLAGIRGTGGPVLSAGARGGNGMQFGEKNLHIAQRSWNQAGQARYLYTPHLSIIQYPTSQEVKSMAKKGGKKQPKEPQN